LAVAAAGDIDTMSGLGGIAPQQRDLSRRRDRQAAAARPRARATDFGGGIFQG
jgi:hypothetical protein